MKIASRPTTIARTPRPSANAARMIAMPRICPAASGLRPIAWADRPARMPMPMPGPKTPRAARPAPMCSIRDSSCSPSVPPGINLTVVWARLDGSVGGLEPRGLLSLDLVDRLLGDMAFLFVVTLDGEDDEHQRQHAEDEGLDRGSEERRVGKECRLRCRAYS